MFLVAATLANPAFAHNENRTWDLLRALADGRLWIDPDAANTVDKAFANGHYYSGGAPGLAFLLLPLYELARLLPGRLVPLVLVLGGAALPLALGAVAVRRAVRALTGCSDETALLAGAAHGLATIALPFGTRLYAHAAVIALLGGALALVLSGRRVAHFSAAGLLAALAVTCDYNVAVAAAGLGILVLLRGGIPRALAFAAGAVPPALALGAYHQACFGSPFHTPYDHHADPHTRALVQGGYGFSYPRPSIVLELLAGTRRGFLFTQPAALLGLGALGAALVSSLRARDERARVHAVALGVTVLSLLSNAARAHDWHAGSSFGARYACAALPFVALGYPRLLETGWPGLATLGASAALALLGATTDWGFDVRGNAEQLLALGPRATGALTLFLGTADRSLPCASLSVLVLAVVVPVALALVAPATKPSRLGALALAVVLACLPGWYGVFSHDSSYEAQRSREIGRDGILRKIASVHEPAEARSLVDLGIGMNDRAIALAALDRLLELDPGDARARELQERLRPR